MLKNETYLYYQLIKNTKENNITYCFNPKEQGNKGRLARAILANLKKQNALTSEHKQLIRERKLFFRIFDQQQALDLSELTKLNLPTETSLQYLEESLHSTLKNIVNYIHKSIPSSWWQKLYAPFDQLKTWLADQDPNLFKTTPACQTIYDQEFFISLYCNAISELEAELLIKSTTEFEDRLIGLQEWVGPFISPITYVLTLTKLKSHLHISKNHISTITHVLDDFFASCRKQQTWLEKVFVRELYDTQNNKDEMWFDFYQSQLNSISYFVQLNRYYEFLKKQDYDLSAMVETETINEQKIIVFKQLQKMYRDYPDVRRFIYNETIISTPAVQEIQKLNTSILACVKQAFSGGTPFLKTVTVFLAVMAAGAAAIDPFHQAINSVKRFTSNDGSPEFRVNVNTSGIQANPFVLTNGSAFSILFDCFDGSAADICVRFYNGSAVAVFNQDIRLNTNTQNAQSSSVGICRNTEYQVFWNNNPTGSNTDIWMNRFDSNWNPLTTESAVTNTLYHQQDPAVAQCPTNSLLVWQHGVSAINYDIHGFRISPQGTLIGSEFQVNNITSGNQFRPSVTWTGIYYAVAFDSTSAEGGTGQGIIVRFLDLQGSFSTGDLLVNTQTLGIQRSASVASNLQNGLCVWEDTDNNVYGRFFTADGQLLNTQFRINTITMAANPIVTALANNNYLVTYDVTDGTSFDVYGREITPSGVFKDPENQLNVYTTGNQQNTATSGFPPGDVKNFVVVWQGTFNTDSDAVIGRYFNTPTPPTTGVYTTGTTGIVPTSAAVATTIIPSTSTSAQQTLATTGQITPTSASSTITFTSNPSSSTIASTSSPSSSSSSSSVSSITTAEDTAYTFISSSLGTSTSTTTTNINTPTTLTSQSNSNTSSANEDNALAIGLGVAGAIVVIGAATLTAVGVFKKCRKQAFAGRELRDDLLERLKITKKDERFQANLASFLVSLQQKYLKYENLFDQEEFVRKTYADYLADILNSNDYFLEEPSRDGGTTQTINLIKATKKLDKIVKLLHTKYEGKTETYQNV